uniref:Ab2-095 n=1 Tax=Rattus norvegicus TaxID=10116 RepID=Q7TP59_RAT|nr:Ab2-095 [Rattus norvegicus]
MVAVNYVGEELWSYFNAPWEKRVDLAWQLMEIAEQLTNNDFEFALYLLDVSFDNFAVGPRDGKVIIVDAENVLVADKRLIRQNKPENWDVWYESKFDDCDKEACLSFSKEILCARVTVDHNYYAVCQNLLSRHATWRGTSGGLLHDPPSEIAKDGRLEALLDECTNPKKRYGRFQAAKELRGYLAQLSHNLQGKATASEEIEVKGTGLQVERIAFFKNWRLEQVGDLSNLTNFTFPLEHIEEPESTHYEPSIMSKLLPSRQSRRILAIMRKIVKLSRCSAMLLLLRRAVQAVKNISRADLPPSLGSVGMMGVKRSLIAKILSSATSHKNVIVLHAHGTGWNLTLLGHHSGLGLSGLNKKLKNRSTEVHSGETLSLVSFNRPQFSAGFWQERRSKLWLLRYRRQLSSLQKHQYSQVLVDVGAGDSKPHSVCHVLEASSALSELNVIYKHTVCCTSLSPLGIVIMGPDKPNDCQVKQDYKREQEGRGELFAILGDWNKEMRTLGPQEAEGAVTLEGHPPLQSFLLAAPMREAPCSLYPWLSPPHAYFSDLLFRPLAIPHGKTPGKAPWLKPLVKSPCRDLQRVDAVPHVALLPVAKTRNMFLRWPGLRNCPNKGNEQKRQLLSSESGIMMITD